MQETPDTKLEQIITRRIEEQDGLDFAAFMGLCLYHPQYGYYMTDRVRIGKQGDFFTSSSVHSLFGTLIARQIRQMWDLLDRPEFTIVEQGAGDGHLAADILDHLQAVENEFYRAVHYRIIEVSAANRTCQRERLAEHGDRVSWSEFDDLTSFTGCFLSNELIDALPVHVVEKRNDRYSEVHVVNANGGFGEELRPDSGRLQKHFDWLGAGPCEGNRGEANLAAVDWMRRVGERIGRGFVLTIDYGYPAEELYAPFRRNGTIMCYHRHTSNDNPYLNVGLQDITAHVDFTALQKAGDEAGLDLLYFDEQYRFLMALGFVEELMRLQERTADPREAAALRMTLKNLVMPDQGMGSTFKVQIQGKDVGKPDLLCSRRIADIPIPGI